ncbi:MAG: hypothetical protein Q8N23_17550 [Archangium sp.]|nr:hypothetical protein [Archangium sp.]MDP3154487.1 hypothetical protein [Archangium sp.]MDP3572908.1 hypothetical protein [Archangium sp.]
MKRAGIASLVVFAFACGKTVFSTERFACSTSAECADGFECRGGECLRGDVPDAGVEPLDGGAGSACSAANPCEGTLRCIDGVCCTSACEGPCASCAQGTCVPLPAGTEAASCNAYACDGVSTSCATTCTKVTGCNTGFACVAPTCGRCWSSVKSEFNQAGDPAWALSGAVIGGGQLSIAVTSRNGMSSRSSATSTETLPLVGCDVTFELTAAPAVVAGYTGRVVLRADNLARVPAFAWEFDTRGLVASWALADGGVGEQVVVPAGTPPPRWLRLEESGGQVVWRSRHATDFTTLHTLPHAESLTGMKLEFTGEFPPQPGNERVSFSVDSLNLP